MPKGAADLKDIKVDQGTDTTFAPPISLLLVVLIVVLALLVRRVLRRRHPAPPPAGPRPAEPARLPERV
jgi:hypothetical protein